MLDIFSIIVIIIIGFSIKNAFQSSLNAADYKTLNYLWLYHILFGIIYWVYVSFIAWGDATNYYNTGRELSFAYALNLFLNGGPGTNGMYLLTVIPANLLSFFSVSLLFTLLGYIGMVFFYVVFKNNIAYNSYLGKYKLFPLIFFLPNLHFWSAGLGKDTLSFLCIGMFIYGMQKPNKHVIKILLALGLSYIIRPHISVFLVASFGIAYMLDGNLKLYQKIFFTVMFFGAFIILFNKFMSFLQFESLDMETIENFSNTSSSNLSRSSSGSSIDISSYPYPLKILTFLYRPFFFDINNVLAIVASFENLLLLVLSIKFVRLNPIKLFRMGNYIFKGMFLFFLMGALTFSLILGNLGIMLREKNMFTPALLFICLWGLSYAYQQKQAKIKPS
ncbi:MAG: hypothetical protein Q8O88_01740 [bacterium]|nr:hypothetical protein [bacterium]